MIFEPPAQKNGSQTTNTKTLTEQIYEQRQSETVDIALIQERKKMVEAAKEKAYGKIYNDLLADSNTSADMKKILMLNREKGAGA